MAWDFWGNHSYYLWDHSNPSALCTAGSKVSIQSGLRSLRCRFHYYVAAVGMGNRQKTTRSLRGHWDGDLLHWSGCDHVLAEGRQLEVLPIVNHFSKKEFEGAGKSII